MQQHKQKGLKLKRVHCDSTQVSDTRIARRRNGIQLEVDFKVRRKCADEEQTIFITEKIDEKLDVQRKAEAKQNRTFVMPKLTLIDREEYIKAAVLRGKERAAKYQFCKELVASNSVQGIWDVTTQTRADELDRFFMKKQSKQRYSRLSLQELSERLIQVPDEKRSPTPATMSSINSDSVARETSSAIALVEQPKEVIPTSVESMLASLMQKMNAMEERLTAVLKENAELKQQLASRRSKKTARAALKVTQVVAPSKEEKPRKALKSVAFVEKPQVVEVTQVKPHVTKTVTIIGEEQCEVIVNSKPERFEEKPTPPKRIKANDRKSTMVSKVREWYKFDPKNVEEHQKKVLSSVVSELSYAEALGNSMPSQVIKHKREKAKKITPFNQKYGYNYYGGKPKGVPNNLWWSWCLQGPVLDAYDKAYKYLFNVFRREVLNYRSKWSKFSKEFNPYLAVPRDVWRENTSEYEYDIDEPAKFMAKWKVLVQTYKPVKPIKEDWYKTPTKSTC